MAVCVGTRSLDLNFTSAVIQESLSCTFFTPSQSFHCKILFRSPAEAVSFWDSLLQSFVLSVRGGDACVIQTCSNTSWPFSVVHHNHSPQLFISEQPCWDWSVLLNSSSLIAIGEQDFHSPYPSRLSSRFKNLTVWFLSAGQVHLPDCVYFFRLCCFSSLLFLFPAHLVSHKTAHLFQLLADGRFEGAMLHCASSFLSRLCRCTEKLALEKRKKACGNSSCWRLLWVTFLCDKDLVDFWLLWKKVTFSCVDEIWVFSFVSSGVYDVGCLCGYVIWLVTGAGAV